MCLYPKLINNRKYTKTKKNKGVIPECNDERLKKVAVGCGKCIECRKQKARSWAVRLKEETRENKTGKFVTLTFNNESYIELAKEIEIDGYTRENAIVTLACRRFLERWRKKYKVSVKHWLVSELGSGRYEHVHLHGIIYSDEVEAIKEKWAYGYVFIGQYVNEKSINYMVKYINKVDEKQKHYNPVILCSPGIGSKYMERSDWIRNKYKEGETNELYTSRSGHKQALPIYLKNKIYSEEEREKLWIEKLDKGERYVLGKKAENWEHYIGMLNEARNKSEWLGYRGSEQDWDEKFYEIEQRNLKFRKRKNDLENRNNNSR